MCVCVSPTKLKVVASFLLTFHFVCSLFAYSLSLSLSFPSFTFLAFCFLFCRFCVSILCYLSFFVLFLSYYLLCIFSFFVFSIIDCLSFFLLFSLSLYLPRSVSLEASCFDFTFLFFLDLLSRSHSLGVPRLAVFFLVFMNFHNYLFSSFFLYISK